MVKISFLDKKLDSRLCIAIFIPVNRELAGSERERERLSFEEKLQVSIYICNIHQVYLNSSRLIQYTSPTTSSFLFWKRIQINKCKINIPQLDLTFLDIQRPPQFKATPVSTRRKWYSKRMEPLIMWTDWSSKTR